MTDTSSSDPEEEREIQAATNAFGALLPKLEMYNGAILRPYSMDLNARQEPDKSTITPSTKFSALMAGRNT